MLGLQKHVCLFLFFMFFYYVRLVVEPLAPLADGLGGHGRSALLATESLVGRGRSSHSAQKYHWYVILTNFPDL